MRPNSVEATYRPLSPEYAEGFQSAVAEIAHERRYLATTEGYSLEETRKYLERLQADSMPGIVAFVDKQLVGWCDVSRRPGVGFAHSGTLGMGVLKQWRRRGIGRQLIERCLVRCRDAGFERIELIVYSDNQVARSLYEEMGFELEGTKRKSRKVDGRYQDELIMALCF